MLFMQLSYVDYTEVICTPEQTIFAAAQGIISYTHGSTVSVVSYSIFLLTTMAHNEFGQHIVVA